MSIEYIDFTKRSDLNAAVARYRNDDDVIEIDVIENGRTLRLVRASEAVSPVEPTPNPEATVKALDGGLEAPEAPEGQHVDTLPGHENGCNPLCDGEGHYLLAVGDTVVPATEDRGAYVVRGDAQPVLENGDSSDVSPVDDLPIAEDDDDDLGLDEPVADTPDIDQMDRAALREYASSIGLEVDIPNAGPLAIARGRVKDALDNQKE